MPSRDRLIPLDQDTGYPKLDDAILVTINQGPGRASETDRRFLFTTELTTCIGIAISGVNPGQPSDTRYNRFMIHTDTDAWEYNYAALLVQVELAKAHGLKSLHAHVTVVNLGSGLANEQLQSLKEKLRELVRHDNRIHWYLYPSPFEMDKASMALFRDGRVVAQYKPGEGDNV